MIRVCEQGGARNRVVDSYLGRETGLAVLDTNRQLARQICDLLPAPTGVQGPRRRHRGRGYQHGRGVFLAGDPPVTWPRWPMGWSGS